MNHVKNTARSQEKQILTTNKTKRVNGIAGRNVRGRNPTRFIYQKEDVDWEMFGKFLSLMRQQRNGLVIPRKNPKHFWKELSALHQMRVIWFLIHFVVVGRQCLWQKD